MKYVKYIFIILSILFIILLVNKTSTSISFDKNLNNMIGCHDYTYNLEFSEHIPVTIIFYIKDEFVKGETTVFKKDYTEEQKFSTILHCGYDYHVVYSSPGYKDYIEDMQVKTFKPVLEERKLIAMEKL